ncbi:MAG: plasmid pRiA4b ORF-3 family protein [Phycisphaeraceae bacterium]|nr:plasmid pRiA4b ORF-3 family protein [Phycisphaeraceae bacterium]
MVYTLRIVIRCSKPPIWRKVAAPSDMTLGQLHQVIQIVMGWEDEHLHQFKLTDKSLIRDIPGLLLKLTKEGRWSDIFTATHGVRVFVAATTPYGEPTEMEGEDEDSVTLAEVCPKVKTRLTYEYDFGDSWEHIIEVQKIEEPKAGVAYPVCLGGKLACPPEDCGGIHGYYNMLAAVIDPKHEDHESVIEWMGDDYDPEAFDLEEVNAMLAKWRRRKRR